MRQIYTLVFVFLCAGFTLSGCAATPEQVLNGGSQFSFKSAKTPKNAAECLAKSSKNASPAVVSDVRDGDINGTYQVTVASVIGDGGTWAVLITSPNSKGSNIEAYLTNSVLFLNGEAHFANSIAGKCL